MEANPIRFAHFIDNAPVAGSDGESIPVIDPSTGQTFAQIARGRAAEIGQAVSAARRAFDGRWGRLSAVERGRLLRRWGDAIDAHAEAFGQLEAQDTRQPLKQARPHAPAVAPLSQVLPPAPPNMLPGTEQSPNQNRLPPVLKNPQSPTGVTGPHSFRGENFLNAKFFGTLGFCAPPFSGE